MPKYVVNYSLDGSIVVEADSKEGAYDLVKGYLTQEVNPVTDQQLINGIEGYQKSDGDKNFTIDSDAIHIHDVFKTNKGD